MSPWEILLIASLALSAIAITVGDLLVSYRRHRRPVVPSQAPVPTVEPQVADDEVARREAIRRRLAAIQAAGEERQAILES